MKISNVEIGISETYLQTITDADIEMYAGIFGDINLVHLNNEYAKKIKV